MNESNQTECQKLLSQLTNLIDGELSPELCTELEQHLKECKNCRIVVDTTKRTIELYHDADSQVEFPMEARGKLFKKLNLDQFTRK